MKFGSITTGIITDGLVFNMDAANRASYPKTGIIATDTVENLTGTFYQDGDPLFVSTTGSGVFDFDGIDSKITIGANSDLSFTSTMTIGCFVNVNTYNASSWSGYVTKRTSGEAYNLGTDGPEDKHMFWIYDTGYKMTYSPTTIDLNTWVYVVGTADGSNITCYVNAIPGTPVSYNGTIDTSNSETRIGYNNVYLDGQLGPIHIYNRALSSNEVLHNYNALKGRFT